MATAESCTGGLAAAACTALAGSSEWFERGWVTYSNAAKAQDLGVDATLIDAHGAGAAAWLLLPGDSFAYWTRLLWQPDRVGDVAELRNKSLLGLLERWLPLPGVEAVWLVAALTLAAIVLVRAARAADEGDAAGAAVAVGCLSAAVAPITWIHHLGWAVLAAWLLLTRPGWGWKTLGIAAAALLSVASPFCDPPPGVALDQLGRLGQDLPTLLTLALAVAVPASAGGVRVSVRADRLARG